MPWFLWVMLFVCVGGFFGRRYLSIKRRSQHSYSDDFEVWWLPIISGLVLFIVFAGDGYWGEYNRFIFTHNEIGAIEEKIKILEQQEEMVLTLVNAEAQRFLRHEERILKDLKIDRENLSAVLIAYPQLRSSEVIDRYLNDIRGLREQITTAQVILFEKMAKYNSLVEGAYHKHFKPEHLPNRLKYERAIGQ